MSNFAQIDANSIVVGVSELRDNENQPHLVKIDGLDFTLIGKKYENGVFIEVPKTQEQLLQELQSQYLTLIRNASDLGETEEVSRLQVEYQQKKTELLSAQ
jgi:hypothetical protein